MLEILVQFTYFLFNCHPGLSKTTFLLFSHIFRISGVKLPYRQRSGQLLLPEEGIFRRPSVQWLQPHHSWVQVRQSGERHSTGRIPASLSVAFKGLRNWILFDSISISDYFEFISWRRKIKVESLRIDVSVRTLHNWHGKEALFLRARSWRFSSNVLCCQTESLLGCKTKKQSGLRCHDPCMLETLPVGRSALFSHVCRTCSPPHQHC